MGKTDFAVLETQRIAKSYGVRFYRPGPVDKAYAGRRFENRMPLWEKVLYALAPFCMWAAIHFNNFH